MAKECAAIARYVREGRPVVLVYPDGEERLLQAPKPPIEAFAAMIGNALRFRRSLRSTFRPF